MSNMTILEQNALMGFEHEDTQVLYLRGAQMNEMRAFKMACEWQDHLRPFMALIGAAAMMLFHARRDGALEDLTNFIRERHFYSYFPKNGASKP